MYQDGAVTSVRMTRRVAGVCGAVAFALFCAAYATTGSATIVAATALAGASLLTQLAPAGGGAPLRRDRWLLPLIASVAVSTTAALVVVWAAVTPAGPVPCVGPSTSARVALLFALANQLAAGYVVLTSVNTVRRGVSWWALVRYTPRLRVSLAVVLHLAAVVANAAVLVGVVTCHSADSPVVDALAAGTVAAAIATVDLVLIVRLVGLFIVIPAAPADATNVELALLAADIRTVGQLRVLRLAPDELLVTARVGLPPGADVAQTLHRAHAHIHDFVPHARHVYLQPDTQR